MVRAWVGALAVLCMGLTWSVLLMLLHVGGHAPSFTLLPIPRERHYLAQAIYVVPVLLLTWWLMTMVAHRICLAGGGKGTRVQTANVCGFCYAVPTTLVLLVPDLVVFLTRGFSALGPLVRITAPLSGFLVVTALVIGLRRIHAVRWGRSVGATLAAVGVQLVISGILLR